MERIPVKTPSAAYDIVIGREIMPEFTDFLRQKKYRRALIVTDDNVIKLHGGTAVKAVQAAGVETDIIAIPAGEAAKNFSVLNTVYTKAIETGLDRKSPIIALGGGVVGDLAGFAAATYLRGVPLVQIPTSLLAQVDSSVGGKTAVNHPLGKNLIGAFYQPQGVFIELNFLDTLPKREISTGLGEIIKYGVIWDEEFFRYQAEHTKEALELEDTVITKLIARSCAIKAEVVSRDEKETDLRRVLNFGHTVGHAIEKETGYTKYNHGEAVAIGMLAAAHISVRLGLATENDLTRLENLIAAFNLPKQAENCRVDNVYADLFHDKKTLQGKIHWVLMQSIGGTVIKNDVPENLVKEALQKVLTV